MGRERDAETWIEDKMGCGLERAEVEWKKERRCHGKVKNSETGFGRGKKNERKERDGGEKTIKKNREGWKTSKIQDGTWE